MSLLGITYGAEVNGAKSPLRLNYFVALPFVYGRNFRWLYVNASGKRYACL